MCAYQSDTALKVLVRNTLWIVPCTVVSQGAPVFAVVFFVDGEEAVWIERMSEAFCHQEHVLVHRGWSGDDVLYASTYVDVGASHLWNTVPYLSEVLQRIYNSVRMCLC